MDKDIIIHKVKEVEDKLNSMPYWQKSCIDIQCIKMADTLRAVIRLLKKRG